MQYEYQLKIANLYSSPLGNVKKNSAGCFFDKEKYVIHYENFRLGLKLRELQRVL